MSNQPLEKHEPSIPGEPERGKNLTRNEIQFREDTTNNVFLQNQDTEKRDAQWETILHENEIRELNRRGIDDPIGTLLEQEKEKGQIPLDAHVKLYAQFTAETNRYEKGDAKKTNLQ